jgi:hypothetical protein
MVLCLNTAVISVLRNGDMFCYLKKTAPCWYTQWHRPGFLIIMVGIVYIVSACSSPSPKQLYENFEFGISLEKPGNWSLEFYERNGSIVLEAKDGIWNKNSARIEIYGYACIPSLFANLDEELESNIDRMRTLYNLDSVTIVQESTKTEDNEVAMSTIMIPTISLPEDSTRNQIGIREPDVFQIVDILAIRNSNNESIMVYLYKGNSEELNIEAKDIVDSIKLTCST